jgi:hypothetical protein
MLKVVMSTTSLSHTVPWRQVKGSCCYLKSITSPHNAGSQAGEMGGGHKCPADLWDQ